MHGPELGHMRSGDGEDLRHRHIRRQTGDDRLTVRRDLQQHELVAVAGEHSVQPVRHPQVEKLGAALRDVIERRHLVRLRRRDRGERGGRQSRRRCLR